MPAILEPGSSGLLISQTKSYGAQHFRILTRAIKNFFRKPLKFGVATDNTFADELFHHVLHTQYSARHEILFDFLDSKVLVESAENPDAGTGLTLNHLVATEVAYWKGNPEALLAQAKETVPAQGTVDLESTPNGMGGYFFEEWQRAGDAGAEFTQRFYPWWWEEEYADKPGIPEEKWTDEEETLAAEFGWLESQVAWRRSKKKSLRNRFVEKYPENTTDCFLLGGGEMFFDKDLLREIKLRIISDGGPLETYHNGTLKIFKRRIPGRRYIIGADVAEGKLISSSKGDNSAAVVFDMDSGEEVAAYCSKLPPEEFARDLVQLAELYNDAMIAPERNGPGGTVILEIMRQCLYGNVYMHKDWHRERKQTIPVAGFPTNPRTRPIACNKLAEMIRTAPELWHDNDFIDEATTFVWVSSNKIQLGGKRVPQGAPGCKDDRVMARAVGAYCRLVVLGYLDPIEYPSEQYGESYDWTDEERM